MHVVCFDIDGTLVASADFDGDLYEQAVRDVLGVDLNPDWSQYRNVSDSGILERNSGEHSRFRGTKSSWPPGSVCVSE